MRNLQGHIHRFLFNVIVFSVVCLAVPAASNPATNHFWAFGQDFGFAYLRSFNKWQEMVKRYQINYNEEDSYVVNLISPDLTHDKRINLTTWEIKSINSLVNSSEYISDLQNYGVVDYWATPYELFIRGGDCEDFAIAKYFALRSRGLRADKLRIVIVYDTTRSRHHAILLIDHNRDIIVLDSLSSELTEWSEATQYEPIFSLNERSFWIHKGRALGKT